MKRSLSKKLWETPEITHINMLPATSCLVPFESPEAAKQYKKASSTWYKELNGVWRFRLFEKPELVPEDACTGSSDPSGFRDINVPANWTLEDTDDNPIYTNSKMPFDNDPPFVPEENPTGVYRTSFELPGGWEKRRTVIHFGGVESYLELHLNGSFVGMAKDTRLPSEFDLTQYLVQGTNHLAAKVIRWSDSSYIEDQDQWWMAGIYRDVYLYSTDRAYIDDVFARGDYDLETREGILDIDTHFAYGTILGEEVRENTGPESEFLLDAALFGPGDHPVWNSTTRIDRSFRIRSYDDSFHARLPGISPWSTETPSLYTLVLTLRNEDGSHIESRSVRVGFRNIRIENRELLINGKAVLIRGVNRHEHDDRKGKVMTRELMLTDIRLLKQFNFNAVRTSHYPDTIDWYDLCDEYGIYLIDEANIEAHANYHTICRNPRWRKAFEERMLNMVKRDKNHPSIIAWSAGNETGNGENHTSAIDLVRNYDPTRFIHHEGEVKTQWRQTGNVYTGGDNRYNDMVNPMYPPIEDMIRFAVEDKDPRPAILCEYSHAMGNSNGSLSEYWDAFDRYRGLQGGFIWEWVDHGIVKTDDSGREYWGYGGDFGETIHDSNFVADGLVSPAREPHPGMYEFKKAAQPIRVHAVSVSEGRFLVENRRDFTSLEDVSGRWEIRVEGIVREEGVLPPLTIPAGCRLEYEIDYADPGLLSLPEAYVHFSFTLESATAWSDAGHEIAWEQFRANDLRLPAPATVSIEAAVEGDSLVSETGRLRVTVPKNVETGPITRVNGSSIAVDGRQVISAGPRLNLFRATTDNDGIRGWTNQDEKPMGQWLAAGLNSLTVTDRSVTFSDGTVTESVRCVGTDSSAKISCDISYRFASDSLIRTDVVIDVPATLPTLPRIGIILTLVPGFESLTWYGRGPEENHIDRKRGYAVGRYSGTVADQYVPYIMPQENGSKCDVRWFELTDDTGGIRFIADRTLEFSAHHFTPEDLFASRHTPDVEDRLRKETIVCIDHIQRGVGTGSCGPQTRPAYCIAPGRYEFGFWIEFRS